MSTPCCELCQLRDRQVPVVQTNRIQDAAQRLQLGLDVIFFSLQLSEGQMGGAPVDNGLCGRPRRHCRRVDVAHG